MPTKAAHRKALATLDVTPVDYVIESFYEEGVGPIWGTAYQRDGVDLVVIETHGCHTDNEVLRNRYWVRRQRGTGDVLAIRKLKREALAAIGRMGFLHSTGGGR